MNNTTRDPSQPKRRPQGIIAICFLMWLVAVYTGIAALTSTSLDRYLGFHADIIVERLIAGAIIVSILHTKIQNPKSKPPEVMHESNP